MTQTCLQSRNRLKDIENRLAAAKGEGGWLEVGMAWEFGVTITYRMDGQQSPTV